MKKLLKLLLTIFIIFTLVGCGDKQQKDITTIDNQSQNQEVIQENTKQEETVEEVEEVIVEEPKEEIKTVSEDITNMYFWVVFFDKYGNELQREALKYGTVPEYKGWLPEGFDKWVYKKSGKDVGSFKSITGNTYYQAVCHEVSHSSGGSSGSNPSPIPQINEYGFYYNAKYYGSGNLGFLSADVSLDIIFTDIESSTSPGSKYAILNVPYPSLSIHGAFLYSVNSNVITLQIGNASLTSLDITISDNSLDINLAPPYSWEVTMYVVEQNVNAGITGNHFLYKGSELISTIDLESATSINLPSGYLTIGDCLLFDNSVVQSVNIPSSYVNIGYNAFYQCTSLTSISLPDNLQTIGESAFAFSGLNSITIPRNVNSISDRAFNCCSSLMDVTFANNSNTTELQERAFAQTGLTSIILPNSITKIGKYAFNQCEYLTSITIPTSVAELDEGCFSGCIALNSINYNGTIAQWNNIVKGQFWNSSVPATYIQCSDGQVSLS